MTVTYASSVYTVTGGFASGTLSSAASKSFTVASALTTMKNRSIWITGGTGAGQRRNILTDGSATTFTIDQAWTVTPDNTSTYLISHRIDDLYAVSTAALTKTVTLNTGANQDSERRSTWLMSGRIVVGNSSTRTYLKFDDITIVSSFVLTSSLYAINITSNAVLQWGDYEPNTGISYNSGTWVQAYYDSTGNGFLAYIWNLAASSNSELNFYGLNFHALGTELTSLSNVYWYWNAGANSIVNLINCNFRNLIVHNIATTTVNFTGTTFSGYVNAGATSTISDLNVLTFSKAFELRSAGAFNVYRAKLRSFNPLNSAAFGELSVSSGAILNLYDPDWSRKVTQDSTSANTFSSSAVVNEYFGYNATCLDNNGNAVQNVNAFIYPKAGTVATTYNGSSNASGVIGPLYVQTGLWNSSSSYDAVNLVYNPNYSNYSYGVRLRKYGSNFQEFSENINGKISRFPTILNNSNVTLSSGTASAITLSVTDHGASPVIWNGKSFGITIDGANTLTYQQIYHAIQYNLSQVSTTWNSKNGGLWHELMQVDSSLVYKTITGQYLSSGSLVTKGVRVINALNTNGVPSTMMADDGTTLSFTTIQVTGLQTGSIVGLYDQTGTLVESGTVSGTTYTFATFLYSANTYTLKVKCYPYLPISQSVSLSVGLVSVAISQSLDPFVTVTNPATVGAYTGISITHGSSLVSISASITPQQLYDYVAYDLTLIANINRSVWLTTSNGLDYTSSYNLTISSGGSFGSSSGSISFSGTKTLNLATARTYNFIFSINSTSKIILGASGTFNLSSYLFSNGAKIDTSIASGNTATVIVSGTQISNVSVSSPTTGGGTVTLTQNCVITLTGLLSGSTVDLFNSSSTQNSSTLVEAGTVSGTTYTFNSINFTGTVIYSYRIRLYGYLEITGLVTLTSGTLSIGVSQTTNPFITVANPATVSAYTGITINHSTQTITQTVDHSRAELYDYIQYNASLTVNLVYAIPVSSSNGIDLTLTYNYVRTSCALTGTGSLSLPTKTATITSDTSTGQLPITDSAGLRYRVYGLPTVSGSNPVLRSKRVSNSVITNPTVNTNGEAYFTIIAGENYELRGDAIGYAASIFITINSNTSTSTQINLTRFVDSSNNPIYGNGVAGEMALINFNPSTLYITIDYSATYPTISAYSAFDKIEQILASNTGLEFTAHPIWNNGAIEFPRDIVSGNPNPARIQANSANTGIPELLFQVIHDGYNTPYLLFDFSNGKIIRYPTTVNIASGATGSSLTSQQVADALRLAPSAGTIAANSVYDKLTTITNKTNNLPASPASTSDVQVTVSGGFTSGDRSYLQSIPLNPVLSTDSRLNNLDAAISTRLSSSSYISPDNSSISLIKSKTDQLVFTTTGRVDATAVGVPINPLLTNDSRLNNLDAAVSGNSPANVWGYTTRTITDKTGFSLSNTQTFNLTGNITGNLTGSVGSVSSAITLPTIPINWITASGIASNAITNAKLASGAITSTTFATDAINANVLANDGTKEIATAVWNYDRSVWTDGTIGPYINDILNSISNGIDALPYLIWFQDPAMEPFTLDNTVGKVLINNLDSKVSNNSPANVWGYTGNIDTNIITRIQNGLFRTSSYTAPNNNSIANIDSRTARVDALIVNPGSGDRFSGLALSNAPISSSITAADVWAYSTRTITDKTGFSLTVSPPTVAQFWSYNGVIDSNVIDQIQSGLFKTSSYTAPDNTGIATIETGISNIQLSLVTVLNTQQTIQNLTIAGL